MVALFLVATIVVFLAVDGCLLWYRKVKERSICKEIDKNIYKIGEHLCMADGGKKKDEKSEK
jgi:hypothetical protein